MKLVTFEMSDGGQHIGAITSDEATISDFTATGNPRFHDMLALMDGGDAALEEARYLTETPRATVETAAIQLLAPVPIPRQIFDCLCFEQHFLQARLHAHLVPGGRAVNPSSNELPPIYRETPVYYKSNRFSVIGPDADIVCPRYSKFLDYELEFGVFLGRTGKNIPVETATDYIFGYCIFNDVSARDQQFREARGMLGPSKGKDFDTGNVMGPWLVTPDEIPQPRNLTMAAYVNGEERSRGASRDMLHSFAEIIAYSSQDETRHAGEFFGSGTVGGGCGLETGRFLAHGDLIELEVSGLGVLRNRVVFQD
jgi:2-keto-4-pentenoate hydratase/2-oxohepta-3-ene-1,7-dioic acid hydratase in catechol pathway